MKHLKSYIFYPQRKDFIQVNQNTDTIQLRMIISTPHIIMGLIHHTQLMVMINMECIIILNQLWVDQWAEMEGFLQDQDRL